MDDQKRHGLRGESRLRSKEERSPGGGSESKDFEDILR